MAQFRRTVWNYWKKNGRHELPWRKTTDPYKILVSEIMLQQTQVSRVIGKYKEFLQAFPTAKKLADAKLSAVLKLWSGLGYNRRGKYLYDAAKVILAQYKGDTREALAHPLPGVGPYTRAAVKVFAFNEPEVLIETNIRTVFTHHFLEGVANISDEDILVLAKEAAHGQDPRQWQWALMDYGAHLKQSGIQLNHRSAHYAKQSKFEGSLRQIRGAILRELHKGASKLENMPFEKAKVEKALASLARDGLVESKRGEWRIV